jgi:hypothetical protein
MFQHSDRNSFCSPSAAHMSDEHCDPRPKTCFPRPCKDQRDSAIASMCCRSKPARMLTESGDYKK